MAKAGIQVRGADQLRRTLRKAGLSLDDLKAAHDHAAKIAAAAARPPVRSGRLAGTVRGSGAKTAATIRAGRASVPYAGVIHWGWPDRTIVARPFLTEAAQRTEPVWVAVYMQARDKALDQIKGL